MGTFVRFVWTAVGRKILSDHILAKKDSNPQIVKGMSKSDF